MNKKQKKMLLRIIAAFLLLIVLSPIPVTGYLRFGLYMVPYLVIGYDILKKAFKGIRNRQVFDENFLMAVATVGAIVLGDYQEGTAVMLFYQIGELFQSYAVGKSRRNISELMDIRPDYANVERDGTLVQVDPDEVEIGTSYRRKSSERGVKRGRGYQRLHQYDRPFEDTNYKGIRRIYCVQDTGSGGEFQCQEIQVRELYFQICQILYTGCVLWGPGIGGFATSYAAVYYGAYTGMECLDLQGTYVSGYQLSMCSGYQYPSKFFCRNRGSKQGRYSGKGFQLSGSFGTGRLGGVRQDRYYDPGSLPGERCSSQYS